MAPFLWTIWSISVVMCLENSLSTMVVQLLPFCQLPLTRMIQDDNEVNAMYKFQKKPSRCSPSRICLGHSTSFYISPKGGQMHPNAIKPNLRWFMALGLPQQSKIVQVSKHVVMSCQFYRALGALNRSCCRKLSVDICCSVSTFTATESGLGK